MSHTQIPLMVETPQVSYSDTSHGGDSHVSYSDTSHGGDPQVSYSDTSHGGDSHVSYSDTSHGGDSQWQQFSLHLIIIPTKN